MESEGAGATPADQLDLATRLASAAPDAILSLEEGTFTLDGCVVIDQPLVLRGAGAERTIIVGKSEDDWLRFEGDGELLIEDLTLRRQGPNTHAADVLVCAAGKVRVLRCRLEGATEQDRAGGAGIRVLEKGRCRIEASDVTENGYAGAVASAGRLTIDGGNVEGEVFGLAAWGNANVSARRATFVGRRQHGFYALGASKSTLEGCELRGAPAAGAVFADRARAEVTRCTLAENGVHGLVAEGFAVVVAKDNDCSDNREHGISAMGDATLRASANRCTHNAMNGLFVGGSAQAALEKNALSKNGLVGIRVAGRANVDAKKNLCAENHNSGISVNETGRAQLFANHCQNNTEIGIAIWDQAQVTLKRNVCEGAKTPILLDGEAQVVIAQNQGDVSDLRGVDKTTLSSKRPEGPGSLRVSVPPPKKPPDPKELRAIARAKAAEARAKQKAKADAARAKRKARAEANALKKAKKRALREAKRERARQRAAAKVVARQRAKERLEAKRAKARAQAEAKAAKKAKAKALRVAKAQALAEKKAKRAQAKAKPKPKAKSKPKAFVKSKPKPKAKPKAKAKPKRKPKPKSKAKAAAKPARSKPRRRRKR
jgi:hypothetical protein